MVRIRLQRFGRRNSPTYRFVVADARKKRQGRCLECLGSYRPAAKKDADKLTFNLARYQHWVGVGAQPSDAVLSLLKHQKLKAGAPAKGPEAKIAAPPAAPAPAAP